MPRFFRMAVLGLTATVLPQTASAQFVLDGAQHFLTLTTT